MTHYLWLIPLGFAIGAYGTLIGAGGGFVLVPILLLLYPHESPDIVTSIALAVVFFNALSGSAAYARMRRIDYRSGLLFSTATIPGSILGALTTHYIPRHVFDALFGIVLIAGSAFLIVRSNVAHEKPLLMSSISVTRTLTEVDGTLHRFSYDPFLGTAISLVVGYLSSLLGIGGGIIHVPALAQFLGFPVHVATATSHFMLAIMALTATVVHIATGSFSHGIRRTIALSIGVVLGAQIGAVLSNRVHATWIMRGLALGLALVGIRILVLAFA